MFGLIALLAGPAAGAAPLATPPRWSVGLVAEHRAEHVGYHFTDPSTFDTATPVPHFFDQHYDASNTWIALTVTVRAPRFAAQTEVAWAPRVTTSGSDLDTFFDPSGDVIVSGSNGLVSLGSFAVSERLGLIVWHGWTIGPMVGYERSTANFAPASLLVTHTDPPSTSATFTTARETTTSQVIESGVSGERRWPISGAWHVRASVDLLPLTVGRLSVALPDKAPPLQTSWQATALAARAQLAIERGIGPAVAGVGLTALDVRSYQQASAYRSHGAGVTIYVRTGG